MTEQEKLKKALGEAVAAIYFADNSDYLHLNPLGDFYKPALWSIVRILGGKEAEDLLMDAPQQAYKTYSENLST